MVDWKDSMAGKLKTCPKCKLDFDYCEKFTEEFDRTIEHKLPLFRNGLHSTYNLAMACSSCNKSKGPKTEEEFRDYRKLKQEVLTLTKSIETTIERVI